MVTIQEVHQDTSSQSKSTDLHFSFHQIQSVSIYVEVTENASKISNP